MTCSGKCTPGAVLEASAAGRIVRCGVADCHKILKELPDHSLLKVGESRGGVAFSPDEFEETVIRA